MDLKLFLEVVKRYKRVVIVGTALAVVLSMLSYGTPGLKGGKPTVIPRGAEVWSGEAQVLISQVGFPYGRAVTQVIPGKGTSTPAEPIGDLSYMANLSSVYAALANGSEVQQQVAAATHIQLCPLTIGPIGTATPTGGGPCSSVVAAPLAQPGTGVPLPLMTLTSSAPTAGQAAKLASTTITVLRNTITRQQVVSGTPVNHRVQLQTVNTGTPATLTTGHTKSIPMLVLFAVVSASIALAFILNNNSDNPVRSTRRRLDNGVGGDGYLAVTGAGNGHVAEPERGLVQSGGRRMELIGLRRGQPDTRLATEEHAAAQPAAPEGTSATDGRWAWSDRTPPHFPRGSGSRAESRD